MRPPCILVVESDDDEGRRIAAWLDEEGYDNVMFCPGPGAPDYTCLGGRGTACPLSDAADVVVVDLRMRSDELLVGTPGWQLMLFYYEQGKKILVISGPDDPVRPLPDEQVKTIERPIHRAAFVKALRAMTDAHQHVKA